MPGEYLSRIVAAAAVMVVAVLPVAGSAGAETHSQLVQATPKGQPRDSPAQTQAQPPGNQEVEGQIADLRRRLNITTAQQAQFDALAQVMRQNAQEMDKLAAQQPRGKASAVEAVRSAQQVAQEDAAALGRLLPPLEALYGTLSDQQKRTVDQLFASSPEQEQEQSPAPKRR